MRAAVKIVLNGKETELDEPCTVADLVNRIAPDRPFVAVALNGRVVPKAEHETTWVHEGDRVDVVEPVGGG